MMICHNSKSQNVKDFYEKEAPEYDLIRFRSNMGKYINNKHKEILLSMIQSYNDMKILEIGIGTARFADIFSEKQFQVYGLDISCKMLEMAKRKLSDANRNTKYFLINGDASQLPFANFSFDGCICINIFSHLSTWKKTLKEISRVLKPGGFLIANFPNLLSYYILYGIIVNIRHKSLRRNVFTFYYRLSQIRKQCLNNNLIIERIESHTSLPFNKYSYIFIAFLKLLDKLSTLSYFKKISPVLFIKAIKL